jgi:hypothetical protein
LAGGVFVEGGKVVFLGGRAKSMKHLTEKFRLAIWGVKIKGAQR